MARFTRVAETRRSRVGITVDGRAVEALDGDTVLTAVMLDIGHVRQSDFGDGERAGFCMMGACQDCWIWRENGERLRACTTRVSDGMRLLTRLPENCWPVLS